MTENFYKYIQELNGAYHIHKNNEQYGSYRTIEDALYERDRLIEVGWDWDLYMELAETPNKYEDMELPKFHFIPQYIVHHNESWVVRGKGIQQKYIGIYYSEKQAQEIAEKYDANICYRPASYVVSRKINGKQINFGTYKKLRDAKERVKQLNESGWVKK